MRGRMAFLVCGILLWVITKSALVCMGRRADLVHSDTSNKSVPAVVTYIDLRAEIDHHST